jgi:hypothetical protein
MKGYTLLDSLDVGQKVRLVGGDVGVVVEKFWKHGIPVVRVETPKAVLAIPAEWSIRLEPAKSR